MATQQNRQSKSSNMRIKPQDQVVVDVSPLNSTTQSKISSKEKSSLSKNSSNTLKTDISNKISNGSEGGGSSPPPARKDKAFQSRSYCGIALVPLCEYVKVLNGHLVIMLNKETATHFGLPPATTPGACDLLTALSKGMHWR